MHFAPALLLAAAATLVTAAPAPDAASKYASASKPTPPASANKFFVDSFVFGCSTTCDFSFNLTVKGDSENHPAVKTPVTCSGGLDADTDYKPCSPIKNRPNLLLEAYIVRRTNELKLRYTVNRPKTGVRYFYTGERRVYAATSDDAAKQKKNFVVAQSGAGAVA